MELTSLSVLELNKLIKKREISPVDIIKASLARIEKYDKEINAICTISPTALEEAKKAEKKLNDDTIPPLLGIPVGIKDVTPVAGLRTTFGSEVYENHIPKQNALVVQRFIDAGAIVVGKTNTPEFAAGANTFNEVFGRTCNPWNEKLSAGGSTGGGAAALAAGMIALAEGTDLGGSLRIPAAFCGVVGMRPSPGLIPTWPAELPWDTLYITGPMARTVEDLAFALQVLSGPSPLSPLRVEVRHRDFLKAAQKREVRDAKIAYCPDLAQIGVDPQIEKACRETTFALREQNCRVEEITLDLSFARESFLALRGAWMVGWHHHHLQHLEQFGENLAGNIRAGLNLSPEQLAAGENARARLWHLFADLFQKYDYLLSPCTCVQPFPVEQNYPQTIAGKEMKTYIDWIAPTFVLSLTGLPVLSVPCAITSANLPVGLQIAGPPSGEEAILALAALVQKKHPITLPL